MKLLSFIFLLTILVSCGENDTDSSENNNSEKPSEKVENIKSCTYSFVSSSTEIRWTAYKFKSKSPVPGTFNSVSFSGKTEGDSPEEIIKSITGVVTTETVYSADTSRDRKLKDYFFHQMKDSAMIRANIIELNEKGRSGEAIEGSCIIEITMNGETRQVGGTYSIHGVKVEIIADISIDTWNAQNALAAINKACEEKHTAEGDTESVTWPDVKIVITTELEKNCH